MTIVFDVLGTVLKARKGTERIGNQKRRGDHPDHCIVEIDETTQKSSEDLLSFGL